MASLDQDKKNAILDILKKIEYGSVTITIHDGAITQIDKIEKTRFEQKRPSFKNKRAY